MPSSRMQPSSLMALVRNITRPFGMASAKAPTKGASSTYDTTKTSFRKGISQSAEWASLSRAMAAISSALSASDDRNCAAMMV